MLFCDQIKGVTSYTERQQHGNSTDLEPHYLPFHTDNTHLISRIIPSVPRDSIINTEWNAIEIPTVGLLRAGTVEHQLVLGIADIDPLVITSAGVSAGGGAVRRRASLLGDGLAVRNVSDVGALAAIRAGPDLNPVAADVTLGDGQAVLGADVLPEGALIGSCHGSSGEREDGSGDLHLV